MPVVKIPTTSEIERIARHVRGDVFIFGEEEEGAAIWGQGSDVLWPDGESLWLAGGVGAGKSTILQQLILHGIGIRTTPFLDHTVNFPSGVIGYVAADRPSQIRRSFRRMVTPSDADVLAERLDVWRGAFPFDLATAPVGALADFVDARGWAVLAIDSLKDVTSGTTDDDDGLAINRQLQEVLVRGIQLVVNHHDRKGDGRRSGPKSLDDLYGSRWLGAGAGSVVYIAGEPGADEVDMYHLKVPIDRVGPFHLVHDHVAGTTTVAGSVVVTKRRANGAVRTDVLDVLIASSASMTADAVASAIGVSREFALRTLRQLETGKAVVRSAGASPRDPDLWGIG